MNPLTNLATQNLSGLHEAAAAAWLLARRKARANLIDFATFVKPEYNAAAHHRKIAEALERVERGECLRLVIEAPPRHGKSELASRLFPAWAVGKRPTRQIITASYNTELASDIGRDVRDMVDAEEFRALFPKVTLRKSSRSATRWHTNEHGVYYATGVEGSMTGRGADIGIIDDPFKDRKEADSETQRNDVWKWYTNVFLTRLMPNAAIVIMNTRWHEDDLTGRILARAKETGEHWEVLTFPAIKDGQALWPERYPVDYLETIRATMDPRDWLALFQQSPSAEDGTYFKREWFRYYEQAPVGLNTYITVDAAITEGDGDYTEQAVWGVDHLRNSYALDWSYGQDDPASWCEALIQKIIMYRPLMVVFEGSNIEKSVLPFLRMRMRELNVFCPIHILPVMGDKPSKCRSFQGRQQMGVIYWPRTEWAERVISQMLKFPAGKHDDAVDAAGNFGRYLDHIFEPGKPQPKPATLVEAWKQPINLTELMQ